MPNFFQGHILKKLNKELKRQKLPQVLKFSEKGVCRGLSSVYAKYALQGKEDEFFKILHVISIGAVESEEKFGLQMGTVNIFAAEVLQTQEPWIYEPRVSQGTSYSMLKIDNQPLKSAFSFALATSDSHWEKVIGNINLQNDEVLIVSGKRHCVAVRKENNKYKVYDPNYSSGVKTFATEKRLIDELHKKAFEYRKGNIGLSLEVMRHPKAGPRAVAFPHIAKLYSDHFIFGSAKVWKDYDTLFQALRHVHDEEGIEELLSLLKLNDNEIFDAAVFAVHEGNNAALKLLLKDIHNNNDAAGLAYEALQNGNRDAFDELRNRLLFLEAGLNYFAAIVSAGGGGNPDLLKEMLEAAKRHSDYQNGIKKAIKGSVSNAILNNNSECLRLLLKQPIPNLLTDQEKLDYLLRAIKENKLYIVRTLIKTEPGMSKKLLQKVKIGILAADKMDLEMMEELKHNGVPFSAEARQILYDRRNNKGHPLLIALKLLIKFIQQIFKKHDLISYDKKNLDQPPISPKIGL